MNTNPPFQGRGFGYGPMVQRVHDGSTSLAWTTFALVVLLVLMFGAYLIATYAGRGRHHRRVFFGGPRGFGGRPDALEVLRMRFASGQMSRDEFLQATGDLTATAPTLEQPPPPAAA
jgi:uncharacterized membrane protein